MPSSRARSRSRSRGGAGTTSLSDAHAASEGGGGGGSSRRRGDRGRRGSGGGAEESSGHGGTREDERQSGRRARSRSMGRSASIRKMLTRDKSSSSIRSSATAHTAKSTRDRDRGGRGGTRDQNPPQSIQERSGCSSRSRGGRLDKAPRGSSSTGRAARGYDVDLPGSKTKKVLRSLSSRRLRGVSDRSTSPAAARRAERQRDREEREQKDRERRERRERASAAVAAGDDRSGAATDGELLRSERERYEARRSLGDRERRAPASVRIEGGPMADAEADEEEEAELSSPQQKHGRNKKHASRSDASVGSTGSDAGKSAVTSASFYMRSQRRDPLAHARRLTSSRHGGTGGGNGNGNGGKSDWDVSKSRVVGGNKKKQNEGDIFEQHAQREEELVVAFGKRGGGNGTGDTGDNRAPGDKWRDDRRRSSSRDRLPGGLDGDVNGEGTVDAAAAASSRGGGGGGGGEQRHASESCPSMRESSSSVSSWGGGRNGNGNNNNLGASNSTEHSGDSVGGAAASIRALRTRMQSIKSLNLQSEEHDEAPPPSEPQALNLKPSKKLNIPPPASASACASSRSVCSAPAMSHSHTLRNRQRQQEQQKSRQPSFGSLMSGLSGLTSNLKLAGLGAEIEVTQEAMERRAEKRRERAAAGGGGGGASSVAAGLVGGLRGRSTNKSINTASTDVSGLTMTEWEGLDETDGYGDGNRHSDEEEEDDDDEDGDGGESSGDDATTVYGPDRSKRKEMFEDDAFEVVDGLITLASEQPPSSRMAPPAAASSRRFSFKSTKSLGNMFLG